MVRRLKQRRAKRVEIPIEDADLLMRAGADYFEVLPSFGFDPAPRPGLIEDETMVTIWGDFADELEAAWGDPRSPFYMWPEQSEPWIYTVLRNNNLPAPTPPLFGKTRPEAYI
ncbi:hypothetical protein ACFSOZ_26010 [Mesorhizobium newzealandense]|uniref:Uncharacterized protein n=1 Tax=Mesorhizobium newzealandense TaxID=1300302 RepID=A0ABW4UFL2_9HYPH